MININYESNFGNCMFQYAFARLHAETNQLTLQGDFKYKNILDTTDHKIGEREQNTSNTVLLHDMIYDTHRQVHGSNYMNLTPEINYHINGYFQDADLFNNNRDLVRSFFKIPEVETVNTEDTLVTIRLGDFVKTGHDSEIIDHEWYISVLNQMPGKKVIQVCDYKGCNPAFTAQFINEDQERKYIDKITAAIDNCEVHYMDPDTSKDFKKYFQYKNIICSNSTFAWWGCFLSDSATNIISFKKFGFKGLTEIVSHGPHVNNLCNVKNMSTIIDGGFCDVTKL